MAANIFTGATNSNYNVSTNWSLGSVPTAVDGNVATFNITSPNCTVNVASVCNGVDFTGYTNTITMSNPLNVSGNITLIAGLLVSGSGAMGHLATGTLTSNGFTWPNAFNFAGTSQTYTLASDFTVSGLVTFSGATLITINSNVLICNGGITSTTATAGTFTLRLAGGTWSGGAANTMTKFQVQGNCTMTGTTLFGGSGTFEYVSGTVTNTGHTMSFNGATAGMVNAASLTFNNVTVGTSGGTLTLLANLNVAGNLSSGASTSTIFNGATFVMNIAGNLTIASNGNWSGSVDKIVWNGSTTSTWSGNGRIGVNVDINGSGTFNITGPVQFGNATLKYVAGTVVVTGTLSISVTGSHIDTSTNVTWNNVTITLGITVTLDSDMYVAGLFTMGTTTSTTTLNGSNLILLDSFTTPITSGVLTGTTLVKLTGTGNFSTTAMTSGTIRFPIEFAAGVNTVTFNSTTYNFFNTTLTYTSGNIVTTGANFTFGATGCTLTTNSTGLTIDELILTGSSTFNGTVGCTFNTLTCNTVGLTHTFKNGNEYKINTVLTLTGTNASRITLKSDSSGLQSKITLLNNGATHDVSFVNATDIDSSLGLSIFDFKGTLTNSSNWKSLVPPLTMAAAF